MYMKDVGAGTGGHGADNPLPDGHGQRRGLVPGVLGQAHQPPTPRPHREGTVRVARQFENGRPWVQLQVSL
jgi:hypothetical protein